MSIIEAPVIEVPISHIAEDDPITLQELQAESELLRSNPDPEPGLFITFEGCEAVGKTTQIRLAAEWLASEGIPFLSTREPGGTPLGITLRELILDSKAVCCPGAELFLLLADRAQHVSEVIRPSLAEGLVVLCDRFNDSTLAYQVGGGGLDRESVEESCSLAVMGLEPHLTLLLDLDPATAFGRINRPLDRMEEKGPEYHQRVREMFLELARLEPDRFVTVDAAQPPEIVADQVRTAIRKRLEEHGIGGNL
ncbi:MAG: dTMP kinase [Armatimonadota bacterium]|nr:dTMP kinase [Armatimonadota bacterium]